MPVQRATYPSTSAAALAKARPAFRLPVAANARSIAARRSGP